MKECLIVGKTNVGKTLFALNFAEHLGYKNIKIESVYPDGRQFFENYMIKDSILKLTDMKPHKTKCLHRIQLKISTGKKKKEILVVDTSGLIETIHDNLDVRKGISQTLAVIRTARLILHIIDASKVDDEQAITSLGEVDYQIAQFAQLKTSYAMLANKIDLPESKQGVIKLKKEFPGNTILPISALYKKGFKEVEAFVKRNI